MNLTSSFVQLQVLGTAERLLLEQGARCVYATLTSTSLVVQVEVMLVLVVARRYRCRYLVDCAIDPLVALLE